MESVADTEERYSPLPSNMRATINKWWEIPVKDLKIFSDKILGSGQFGIVLLGEVTKNRDDIKCAIKTVKGKRQNYFPADNLTEYKENPENHLASSRFELSLTQLQKAIRT